MKKTLMALALLLPAAGASAQTQANLWGPYLGEQGCRPSLRALRAALEDSAGAAVEPLNPKAALADGPRPGPQDCDSPLCRQLKSARDLAQRYLDQAGKSSSVSVPAEQLRAILEALNAALNPAPPAK